MPWAGCRVPIDRRPRWRWSAHDAFVEDYRIRVGQSQLASLALSERDRLYALCVVSKQNGSCVMNLRAPILINLDRRLGCQVVTTDEQPLQVELTKPSAQLRKSA